MKSKIFEVRDRATFIVVMATQLSDYNHPERELLAAAGYGERPEEYIIVTKLNGGDVHSNYDAFKWGGRTMPVAHKYIEENFDSLETGSVVDVEFALGEVDEPKKPQSSVWG